MAGAAVKNRLKKNEVAMNNLQKLILASNILHLLVRFWHFGDSASPWIYFGYLCTVALFAAAYVVIHLEARPRFDESGGMTSGGGDLDAKGVIEYMFDVVYVCVFVQVTAALADICWLFLLIVPAFAAYKLFRTFFSDFGSTERDEGPADDAGGQRTRRPRKTRSAIIRESRLAK